MSKFYPSNLKKLSIFAFFSLLLCSSVFSQTTVTINCTGPTGSYNSGTVTSGGVKVIGNMVDIDGNSSTKRQGWATFDLSSIPSGSTVNSVTFNFTVYSNNAASTVTNEISVFTGDPSSMTGLVLYNNIVNGTVANTSTWAQNGTNSKTFDATGLTYVSNNLGGMLNIGLWRGAGSSLFRIGGYPYASPPQLVINYTPPAYRAQFTAMNTGAAAWCSGETRTVSVTVKNVGTKAWTDGGGNDFNLGVKWNADADYFVRTDVANLAPGATQTFTLDVTAPTASGTNNLTFDIVWEGVSWFGNNGGGTGPGNVVYKSGNLTINALPGAPTATTTQVFCNSATVADLTTSSGSNIKWYAAATGGAALAPSTPVVNGTTYYASQTNSSGCESTSRKTVTVNFNSPASITVSPVSDIKCAGQTAGFSVTATGNSLTYQWQKNNADIAGATSATYTTPTLVAGDNNATYRVFVTSAGCGAVTSTAATLTVNVPAAITTQPVSQSICAGGPVTFSVATSGTPPLTYQWKKGGVDITGETSASYTISSVTAADAASYTVVITNICNSVTSSAAVLTVSTPAAITTDPVDVTKCEGGTATFSVVATGGPLTYQWQKNNVNIPGATAANYTTPTLVAGDNNATYKVIVTSAGCGSVTSAVATLTVNVPVAINTQPATQTICLGAAVNFSVVTSGTPPLSYQWKKGGANITGETNATLNIPTVSTSDAGSYTVTITNSCNSVTSSPAALTVNTPASVTTPPADQTKCVGQTATFNVLATGSSLSYQWQKNNVNIAGATSSSYTTPALAAGDNGATYRVIVTVASCGSVTSASATLTVNTPPTITTQPAASQIICLGSPASFTVAVTGSPAPTFQWKKGGVNISGATNATYTIPTVVAGDAGTYSVVVINTCGTVTSSNATLVTTSVGSWIGVTSTNWFTPSNWGCGVVPTVTTDVTIPATAPFMPNINGGGAVCQDITINGSLTITGANNLDVYGDWVNNNVFTANTSSVTFRGGTGNTMGGGSTTTFYNLVVNKTVTTNSLTSINNVFNTTNLTITQGNLILTDPPATPINVSYVVTGNVSVAASGILTDNVNWNTNGHLLSVGGNIAIDGIFNYTSGTPHVNMNGAGNKTVRSGTNPASGFGFLTLSTGNYTASGDLVINSNFWPMFGTGGNFYTNGQTVTAKAGVLINGGSLNINGGTLNVTGGMYVGVSGGLAGTVNFSLGTLNADVVTVGALAPPTAANGIFNHSGGTANIYNLLINNTPTASFYNCSNSPIINITGNWTNDETAANSFGAASSQVNFVGNSGENINGVATTFYNLNIANAAGLTLGTNVTVSNILNFSNGVVTTGANTLTSSSTSAAAITGGSATAYVDGKLARNFGTGAGQKVFPVGAGGNYRPLIFAYTSSSAVSVITVQQFESQIPGTVTPTTVTKDVRYWQITKTGTGTVNYRVTLDPTFNPSPAGSFVQIIKKEGTNNAMTATAAMAPNHTNSALFNTFNNSTTASGTNSFAIGIDCSSSADAGPALADFCQGGSTPGLGGSISGTATGGTWSSSAGGTFSPSATNLNAIWTPPANYYGTATLTLTPTGGLCTPNTVATKTVKVIQGPSGAFTATETSGLTSNDNIICAGATVKFTAPSGYGSYIFINGLDTLQTGLSNIFNVSTLPLGVSSIRVNVANGLNCAVTFGPIDITVIDLPTPSLTSDKTSVCPGESVTFTAGGGNFYTFKENGVAKQSSTSNLYTPLTITDGMSVTVDVRDGNSCTAPSLSIVITVKPLPVGTLSTTENSGNANDKKVCVGDNVTFTATAGAGYNYNFKLNNVSVYTASNEFVTQFATAGNPVITVDVTNAGGCTATFGPAQVISVIAPPTGTLTSTETSGTPNNDEICAGSSVKFTATAGPANNYTFYLKGAGAPLYTGASNTYSTTALVDGDYLTVTVTNSNGCASVYTSLPITVVNAPTGTIQASSTVICAGESITLTASAGFFNYTFKRNNVTFSTGSSNISAPVIPLASTDKFTVEVSNPQSCMTIFGPVSVTVNPLPTGTLARAETSGIANNDNIICKGAKVIFTAPAGFSTYNFKINGITAKYGGDHIYEVDSLKNNDVVSVEVTNGNTCSATLNTYTITVNDLPPVLPITAVKTDVCVNENITVVPGTPGGSFSTGNSSLATVDVSSGVVTGKGAGVVTIYYKVTNSNNCDSIVSIDITVNALPLVDLISGASKVCVESTIQLTETTLNGVWSSGNDAVATVDVTGLVTGISAGPVIISYTVTNSNGCITVVTKNITVNALPVVSALGVAKEICVGENLTLTYTSSGGTNVWSSSDPTVATVNSFGLVKGISGGTATITLTVTNSNGCSTTVTAQVIINALPVPTLSGPNPICPGKTETYRTEPGQYNYKWTVVGGVIINGGDLLADSITITWGNSGTKSVYVNYENASGCAAATSVTIANGIIPSPAFSGDLVVCQNTPGHVYSTAAGKEDYTWTIVGGEINSGEFTNSVSVTWTDDGNQSLTLNYAEVGGCNAATPTVKTIKVNPEPTLLITNPAAVCSPSTVNLTLAGVKAGSTPGLTYTYWTDELATTAVPDATKVGAGTYYIKGTTSPGCFVIAPVQVTVNQTPTVVISNPAAICAPGTVDLTATSVTAGSTTDLTFTYWTNAAGSVVLPNPTSVGAGTYYIKGTTALGCFEIKPVVVTVNPKPTVVTHNPAAVCSPSTVDLTLAAVTAGSTAGLTYTYWTDAAGTIAYATPTTAGAGIYYIKGTTGAGCEDFKPVTVTVNPLPTIFNITGGGAYCSGESGIAIGLSGSESGVNYQLYNGAVSVGSAVSGTGAAISFGNQTAAGTYTVIAGNSSTSCSNNMTGSATITVNQLPTIYNVTGGGAYCSGGTGVVIGLSASQSGISYQLFNGASPVGSAINGTGSALSFGNQIAAGTYTVQGTNSTTGCINNMAGNAVVNINTLPIVTANANVCVGSTFTLTPSTGGTWVSSNNSIASVTNAGLVTGKVPGNVTFTYTQTNTGCSSTTSSVTVNDIPTISLLPYATPVCQSTIVTLTATSTGVPAKQNFSKSSGPFNLKIPDATRFIIWTTPGEVNTTLNVSGIPGDAVISNFRVLLNVTHGNDGDLNFNLKAPNGNVLNLINRVGGSNFTNTEIVMTGGIPFPNNGSPYTGTFAPDGSNNIGDNPYRSNSSDFSNLSGLINGNWILYAQDNVRGDEGTINSWSITFDYMVPTSNPVTWSPLTNLYTDANATVAYTGEALTTVYAKFATSGAKVYTATAMNGAGCTNSVQATINVDVPPVITLGSNYCLVPGKVVLTATHSPGSSIKWDNGKITDTIHVDVAGDYMVTATSANGCKATASISVASELVTNGDFEAGKTGFSTDYNPGTPWNGSCNNNQGTGLYPANTYDVKTSGQLTHCNFWGKDHTSGAGNFMLVNGSGLSSKVWQQTINVLPNTKYYFSAWAMSLNSDNGLNGVNNAKLQFSVGGTAIGTTATLTNHGESNTSPDNWIRFYGDWTSGPTTTSVVLTIVDLQTASGGNDFGLDDISFGTLSTFIDLLSAEGTDAQTVCVNTPITDIVYRAGNGDAVGPTVTGLPDGVTKSFSGDKLTFTGTPTIPGNYTYTITTTGCAPFTVTGTITVEIQKLELSAGSSSPTLCINSPLLAIEYTIGGSATSASLTAGEWPAGVSGTFAAGKFIISGTPTVAGVFPYTITTTGNCEVATISGSITVQLQEIELTSGPASQEVCFNEDISTIVYTVGGTATGAGVTGLPPGVSGFFSGGVFIISGKPVAPAAGTYTFTVTTTGTCSPAAIITGSITVNPAATIALSSGNDGQTVCINTGISDINYTVGGGGTGASITSGLLPAGVEGSFSGGVFTLSGTPTEAGTFNYTITTTGTCGQVSITGSMIVQSQTIDLTSGGISPTLCVGSTLANNIVFTIAGTGSNATLTSGSFPNGLTGSYDPGTKKYTISGSPLELGVFPYTISTSGSCEIATIQGIITVNSGSVGGTLPDTIKVCSGVTGTLNLSGQTGNVVRWESSTDYGVTWNNIANTTTTLPYTNITVPTQYKALVKSGSCNAVYSTIALIAIRNYWTGLLSNDWQTAGNWSDNQLPGLTCANVYIPDTDNDPVLANGSSTINNLIIYANAVLTVNGTGALQIAGTITNGGTFDASAGEIELNGVTAQNIGTGTFMNNAVKDFKISNNSGVNLNHDLDVYGSLEFGSSNATLNTNGNLTIKSNINNTAWVGQMTATQKINGDVTVERFINTGTTENPKAHRKSWQLLAVPTDGAQTIHQAWQEDAALPVNLSTPNQGTGGNPKPGYGTMIVSNEGGAAGAIGLGFDQYTAPGPSIKEWDGASVSYKGPKNTKNTNIYNLKGWMVTVRGDRSVFTSNADAVPTTLRSKGTLFTPAKPSLPTSVAAGRFESVGNPYASAIDLRKVSLSSGMVEAFIVWDPRAQGAYSLGAFTTLAKNPDGNFYATPGSTSYPATVPPTPYNTIESGQAFMVQATEGSSGSIGFAEDAKVSGSNPQLLRGQGGTGRQAQLRTNLFVGSGSNTTLADGNLIQYNATYSNDLDKLDARKMTNTSENIGLASNGKLLAVERRAPIVETDTVFFKISGLRAQPYKFEFITNNLAEFEVEGTIEDNYTQTKTPLNMEGKTEYNFTIENIPGSYAADRFRIVFKEIARPLPVAFVSVKAKQEKDDIVVDWKVENETGMKEYEVEKSSDGSRFVKSGNIPALNNGAGTYTWLDKDVTPGWNYYRIKSIDVDGKVSYSEVVKVQVEMIAPLITVYPNPIVNGVINVHLVNQPAGNYKLRLLNALGQTMVAKQITREKGTSIEPLTWDYKLARGNYRIEVTKPDGGVKLITVIY